MAGLFDDVPMQGGSQPQAQSGGGGLFDDVPLAKMSKATEADMRAGLQKFGDKKLLEEAGGSASNPAYAAITSFGNTALLNIPRNLGAAARSVINGTGFNDEYSYLKGVDEAAARQSPWASGAGTVAGAVGGALAVPVAPAASIGGRMLQGAGIGAGYGGLSELADSKDLSKAAGSALVGGVFGGLAPPALEGVIGAGSKAAGAIANQVRPIINPEAEAARRVSGALARDAKTVGQPLDEAALALSQSRGQPAVVADMGGEMTRGLARSAANTSPEARQALQTATNSRFESQAPRVSEFVTGLGSGNTAMETREALQRQAQQANRPAYAKAYAEGANGIWDDQLAQLAQAPAVADAIKQATKTGANKAVADGFKPPPVPFAVDEAGNVALRVNKDGSQAIPSLQFWDHVKRNLDDAIEKARRAGERNAASDLGQLKDALVTKLDSAAPSYAEARSGAAKFFGAQDALEAGQKFVTATGKNEEFARAIAKMSEPERKLFADGFASQLATKINETGDSRSILNTVFQSKAARERVEMALGKDKAREFEAFMRVEGLMDGLRGVVSGNSTTVRQLVEAGLAGGAAGGALGGDKNSVSIGVVLGSLARGGKMVVNQRVAQRVGEMLASSDPAQFERVVKMAARDPKIMEFVKSVDAKVAALPSPATGAVSEAANIPARLRGNFAPVPAAADEQNK